MKFKVGCALTVLTCLYFDTTCGRAVKDFFSGHKDAQAIEASSEGAAQNQAEMNSQEKKESTEGKSADDSTEKTDNEANKLLMSDKDEAKSASEESKASKPEEIVGDPVVLKIGGKKVFKHSDILAMMRMVPRELIQGMEPKQLFELLKMQALVSYLIQDQAKKAGMDQSKDFRDRYAQMRDKLLVDMYIAKEVYPQVQNEVQLKAAYKTYLSAWKGGDEVKLSYIMTDTEKEAKEVLDALSKGTNFEKLQKEKGNGSESIDRYLPLSLFPEDVRKAIPTIKGKIGTAYAKLNNKYVVFKLNDKRAMKSLTYEEAKPQLQQMVMKEAMDKLTSRLVKQYKIENFSEKGEPMPLNVNPIASGMPTSAN